MLTTTGTTAAATLWAVTTCLIIANSSNQARQLQKTTIRAGKWRSGTYATLACGGAVMAAAITATGLEQNSLTHQSILSEEVRQAMHEAGAMLATMGGATGALSAMFWIEGSDAWNKYAKEKGNEWKLIAAGFAMSAGVVIGATQPGWSALGMTCGASVAGMSAGIGIRMLIGAFIGLDNGDKQGILRPIGRGTALHRWQPWHTEGMTSAEQVRTCAVWNEWCARVEANELELDREGRALGATGIFTWEKYNENHYAYSVENEYHNVREGLCANAAKQAKRHLVDLPNARWAINSQVFAALRLTRIRFAEEAKQMGAMHQGRAGTYAALSAALTAAAWAGPRWGFEELALGAWFALTPVMLACVGSAGAARLSAEVEQTLRALEG